MSKLRKTFDIIALIIFISIMLFVIGVLLLSGGVILPEWVSVILMAGE